MGNHDLSGYSGPFGTVTVDLTSSTTATVTFNADAGFLFLSENLADVNVNATSWTIASFTEANPFNTATFMDTLSGNVDGFGVFNQTTKNHDGYMHAASQVGFTLTDMSGTWTNASSVFAPNSKGFVVAVHVGVCNVNPCNVNGSLLATGYATMPEPPALFFLGMTGLIALGSAVGRRLLA